MTDMDIVGLVHHAHRTLQLAALRAARIEQTPLVRTIKAITDLKRAVAELEQICAAESDTSECRTCGAPTAWHVCCGCATGNDADANI